MAYLIKDKLEIKFLLLYILARAKDPLSLSDIQGLAMIDDGVDYFAFAECLNQLVNTEHVTLENEQYTITQKGIKNSSICEDSIPLSVRIKAEKGIQGFDQEQRMKTLVNGFIEDNANGSKTLVLNFNDEVANIFSLQLLIQDRMQGREFIKEFKEDPTKVYSQLLSIIRENADNGKQGMKSLHSNPDQRKKIKLKGKVITNESGSKILCIHCNNQDGVIYALQLLIPDEKQGRRFIRNFKENPATIYNDLLNVLNKSINFTR